MGDTKSLIHSFIHSFAEGTMLEDLDSGIRLPGCATSSHVLALLNIFVSQFSLPLSGGNNSIYLLGNLGRLNMLCKYQDTARHVVSTM